MMNALLCCKNWLGFHEITKEELVKEHLAEIQELARAHSWSRLEWAMHQDWPID